MWCNRADTTQIFTLSHTQSILYSTNIVELTYIYNIVCDCGIYTKSKRKKNNLGVVFIVIDMHHYMPHTVCYI